MFYCLIFYCGALLGSFCYWLVGECLSDDPINWWRRSTCTCCQRTLQVIDLLPLVHWIIFKGRCHYCHCQLSITYLVSECLTGVGLVWLVHQQQLALSLIGIVLYIMSLCDLSVQWVPDRWQLLLFVLILLYSRNSSIHWWYVGGIFWLLVGLAWCFPNKIGGADLKLLFSLTFLIPPMNYPRLLFVASSLGLLCFAFSVLTNRQLERLPFIPCIALATWWILSF